MCHRMPAPPSGGVGEGPLCQHGGRCVELSHGSVGFMCECQEGWGGQRCTEAPDPCRYPVHVDCGAHGGCEEAVTLPPSPSRDDDEGGRQMGATVARCRCIDGYLGERCDQAPDPCVITSVSRSPREGRG